jgi:organic radical activating enzyme
MSCNGCDQCEACDPSDEKAAGGKTELDEILNVIESVRYIVGSGPTDRAKAAVIKVFMEKES